MGEKNQFELDKHSEILGKLKDIGNFDPSDVIFDETPVPFGLLGGIKPLKMEWMVGDGDYTIPSNYLPVPTHHHEFCIEEYSESEYAKSERYVVKNHRDEYYFESFYNPRDKSSHDMIGLSSQDFYDCIGLTSRIVFEGNGKKYSLIGIAHTFSGLASSFLFRLGDLFSEDIETLTKYWKDLEEEMELSAGKNEAVVFNSETGPGADEKPEDLWKFNKKLRHLRIPNVNNNNEEKEEIKNELDEKRKRMISTYKYFKIDSFAVFGFLLEMRMIQNAFLEFLNNEKVNMGIGWTDLNVNLEFLQSELDLSDDIELGFVQGNKEHDRFQRFIGFKSIMQNLGELSGGEDFIGYAYTVFERAYIRLDGSTCPGKKYCIGNCHNSDVMLDKFSAVVVHYKCGGRGEEVQRYRQMETAVYPVVLATEQFLGDVIVREIEYTRQEFLDEMKEMKESLRKGEESREKLNVFLVVLSVLVGILFCLRIFGL